MRPRKQKSRLKRNALRSASRSSSLKKDARIRKKLIRNAAKRKRREKHTERKKRKERERRRKLRHRLLLHNTRQRNKLLKVSLNKRF